jgi:hypothetical protein
MQDIDVIYARGLIKDLQLLESNEGGFAPSEREDIISELELEVERFRRSVKYQRDLSRSAKFRGVEKEVVALYAILSWYHSYFYPKGGA